MKKYFVFLSVTVALLASCSNDEPEVVPVNPDEYITFGAPAVSSSTRAPLDAFPDGGQFQVIGYLMSYQFEGPSVSTSLNEGSVTTDWDAKSEVTPPAVFGSNMINQTGVTVTYSGGYCTYKDVERWHTNAGARYSFFYYYPTSDRFATMFRNFNNLAGYPVGFPTLTYNMPWSGGSASQSREMDEVDDAMYGYDTDVLHGSGTVTPRLHHMLAGLNVQINNYSTDSDVRITELRIHSSSFRSSVTLGENFTLTAGSGTFGGSFEFVDATNPVVIDMVEEIGSVSGGLSGNSHKLDKTLLLVPYRSASGSDDYGPRYFGDDAMIEVAYTFDGHEDTRSRPLAFGLASIDPGVIYTLQLNFVGSDLVLDFIVDNSQQWEDGNEGDSNGNITFE